MRYTIKGQLPLSLHDLLRKRKINLEQFVTSFGISAYSTLVAKCQSIGVSAPTEEEFKTALGGIFSSPQEGIVVLDSPPLTKDDGTLIKVDYFSDSEINDKLEADKPLEEPEKVSTRQRRSKSLI